jgi:hypothetical protein
VWEEIMQTDPDCIFCKIVAGQMRCFKLLEDDETLSFMDIYPANDGHCLVTNERCKGLGQIIRTPLVLPRMALWRCAPSSGPEYFATASI